MVKWTLTTPLYAICDNMYVVNCYIYPHLLALSSMIDRFSAPHNRELTGEWVMAAFPERREAFPAKPEGGNMNRMEVHPLLPLPSQRPQRKTVPGNRARGCHASRHETFILYRRSYSYVVSFIMRNLLRDTSWTVFPHAHDQCMPLHGRFVYRITHSNWA